MNNLTSERQSYIDTIEDLKKQFKQYENLDPDFYLHILYDTLNYQNCREYDFVNALSRKYVLERKKAHNLFGNLIDNYDGMEIQYMFGIVKEKDKEFIFIDLDENVFTVRGIPNITVRHDDPVSAILNDDGSVDIYWKYRSKKLMNEDRLLDQKYSEKKENLRSNTKKDSATFQKAYLGDYNVLIVTGNNGPVYRDMLMNCGIKADFIDPFEKSPVHLKHALKRPDFVIICTDSTPHYVLELLEEDQGNKYVLVYNSNEDNVYLRLKFAIADYQYNY